MSVSLILAGYTGHIKDSDTGLVYMQARYYDPVIGRLYSNDPVGYVISNPVMSFNRYLYVNNNPYRYTDPTGKCGTGLCVAIVVTLTGGGIYAATDTSSKGVDMLEEGRKELIDATIKGDTKAINAANAKISQGSKLLKGGAAIASMANTQTKGIAGDTNKAKVSAFGKIINAISKWWNKEDNSEKPEPEDSEEEQPEEHREITRT